MLFHEWSHKFGNDDSLKIGLAGYHIEALVVAPVAFVIFLVAALSVDPAAVKAAALATAAISPVWVPLFIVSFFWTSWIEYIRFQFWFSQEHILLEVQLPPEVEKSPLSMELFLTTLWNSGGESTFIARIWKGQFRPVWALEIASNEGRVSYYIHTRQSWRNVIEARLYGQYPEAKITLAEDYAAKVNFNLDDYDLWGTEYSKAQAGAVPIKTYVDYALDKNPDTPEIQVDPITNILEYFSHVGEGEYLWLQIIMKARKKDEWFGFYDYKHDHYKDGGKAEIDKMVKVAGERAKKLVGEDPEKQAQAQARGLTLLTESERRRVEAIEKAMGKLTFECGMRGVYISKKGRFNPVNIGSLVRLFDPVRSNDYNQINPTRGMAIFDYPWQDFHDIRKRYIKKQTYEFYKNRAYFYVPYDQVPVFMNTEELATLWHFPNSKTAPPGLERVASKRSEAPANLPTGIRASSAR
ncbi:MAG TPA: hypothetical protein VHD55_03815 [Candidatus Paceibacterota bacterium]|nr:hypothetical protein [Candidatus Paceibacterota bacterium]